MQTSELVKFFEDHHEEEYLKFDKVVDKLSNRADLCAFMLLDKLVPAKKDIIGAAMIGSAEHDEIWIETSLEELAKVVTENDVLTLIRCGVMLDEYQESLHMFV